MADLTRTAANVRPTRDFTDMVTDEFIAGATIEQGQPFYVDSNGKAQLADANGSGTTQCDAIALNKARAGEGITGIKRGPIMGYDLSGLAYRARVYVSNTVGELADAAGGTTIDVGHVMPIGEDGNIQKMLYVELPWRG